MQWYLTVVRDNYGNFAERACRKEYWMFFLFNMIFSVVALVIDNILGTTFRFGAGPYSINLPYGWIYILYSLAVFIPGLAACVRRLHDIGKSGWWIFIAMIPILGGIWLLVLLCTDGNAGQNFYGPSPKAGAIGLDIF